MTRTRLPLSAALLLAAALAASAHGQQPRFRRHTVNAQSTYSACAALDVNRDGRLDIACGGFWYEAPDFKPHKLRDVEVIRGRYDDYSNLPLDVNGDGWTDLVSCNYRSRKMYWIEHPGKSLGEWTAHEIAMPGAMETGRLADIDGDGRIDLLPNGVEFAAWWELRREQASSGEAAPRWVRHDVDPRVAGHGLGFGDIDGDGRGDLVGPGGWLAQPEDPRGDRWEYHFERRLHPDVSVPILVHDFDGDGDNDLAWARAHNIGIYWSEQTKDDDGRIRLADHPIDTSWSQAHSLLLADVDGDGHQDVVAGKRYMAHEGKDPGAYDPLAIHWYKFDAQHRTWRRGLISSGGGAGFGLDPKAADLDGDGDVDFIGPGRSGLYWHENLLVNRDGAEPNAYPEAPAYDDHSELLVYCDASGEEHPVETPFDWARRRSHILAGMERAMGKLPDPSRRTPLPYGGEVVEQTETDDYIRRKITFSPEPGDRLSAYLLIPRDLRGPAPGMLCLHQTNRIGKGEPAGLGGNPSVHYAEELARRGYVCLAPDYPSFGEYEYDFATDRYVSGSMKAVWNNLRAVDLLQSLHDVDPEKIGVIGHSLGGHNALFTAAFDQRIKAVVTSCGFTAFHDYYEGKLAGWTSERYMPRIRELYGNDPDRVPFDFHEVLAAIAPRGIFVNAPQRDHNFDVGGVKKVIAAAGRAYDLLDARDRLQVVYPDAAHEFPNQIRQQAYGWLDQQFE